MTNSLLEGFFTYLCFLPVLTFHEFAHAWVAWKRGDDTAKSLGRVSLNPVVHMDLLGTVILPLAGILLSSAGSALAGFIIGWGKPVPVNISNLRNQRLDDTLVALAGPAMNILLAIVLMALVKVGNVANSESLVEIGRRITYVSLFLCFFNLIPIPPLDGSHVLKNAINMSHETYARLCQFGIFILIVAIQIPVVMDTVTAATIGTFKWIALLYGFRLQ